MESVYSTVKWGPSGTGKECNNLSKNTVGKNLKKGVTSFVNGPQGFFVVVNRLGLPQSTYINWSQPNNCIRSLGQSLTQVTNLEIEKGM